MNILQALFKTSIGKKVVMAVTGLILLSFVIGHLIGNLQIFSPPEKINGYAHFLQSLGPALWGIRAFLLLTVVLHIWTAIALVIENRAARGSERYLDKRYIRASYASRTMKWSGLIVLAFLIYHLLHFTVKITDDAGRYPTTTLHGETVPDVHSMMVLGFQQPLVSAFYLVSIALLSWHLRHGISSMFQSVGLRTRAWGGILDRAALLFAIVYFLGNALIVAAVYGGYVKLQNPELKIASATALCSPSCKVCETRVSSAN